MWNAQSVGNGNHMRIGGLNIMEYNSTEPVFIYIVELDDKKTWAFKNKKDAIDLMEKKLHMKKDKDGWGIKGYTNRAKLMTLELE